MNELNEWMNDWMDEWLKAVKCSDMKWQEGRKEGKERIWDQRKTSWRKEGKVNQRKKDWVKDYSDCIAWAWGGGSFWGEAAKLQESIKARICCASAWTPNGGLADQRHQGTFSCQESVHPEIWLKKVGGYATDVSSMRKGTGMIPNLLE